VGNRRVGGCTALGLGWVSAFVVGTRLNQGRRLAGGRSLLAVSLEDSVQMLVELPPTRQPTSPGSQRRVVRETGGEGIG
jgi:hypothetical protein